MAKVIWTDEAEQWLNEIYEYIALDSATYASKTINGIYNKTQILNEFPEIGYKYENRLNNNIRILLYGHYRIAYLLDDDTVKVLGVFHGALDIHRYL